MIRISDSLSALIRNNQLLQFGLQNRLFNLAQLAKYLQPAIQARSKKEVQVSAIHMHLSRLQRNLAKTMKGKDDFKLQNVYVGSNLIIATYERTLEIEDKVHQLYQKVASKSGHLTISHGIGEIMVIVESAHESLLIETMGSKPKYINRNAAFVSAKFDPNYTTFPGMIQALVQQITCQNINILEMNSTHTELTFYIEEKDVKLVFDTFYEVFIQKR